MSVLYSQKRTYSVTFILSLCIILAFIYSLSAGAISVSWQVIVNTLFNLEGEKQTYIVLSSRLPRSLIALLVGGCLAVSGTIIQALMRNPLASPKVIGINAGAALAVCLMMMLLPNVPLTYLPLAAMLGGTLASLIVYLGSEWRDSSITRLALIGIAVGFVCDAGIDYILFSTPTAQLTTPLVWLTGSLWSRGWSHLEMSWHILSFLAISALILSYRLDLIRLGSMHAKGLGVNVRFERFLLLAIASLLASISVSVVGVLGFVGLMAPHIARSLVGGSHRALIPTSILVGMLLVVLADACGRAIAPPIEVSAGILTALFGAPFFIYILIKLGRTDP